MTAKVEQHRSQSRLARRQFLLAAGLAGAAAGGAALVAPSVASADDGDGSPGLTGTWLETISSIDGSFPPFQTLFTYSPGGGLVGTADIDAMKDLKSSPTHGAWKSSGARSYTWLGHAFSLDNAGNRNGMYNIRERITLSANRNSYSGSGTFEIVGGTGALPLQSYTVVASRINA